MVTSSLGPYELAPGTSWPPGPGGSAEGTAPDGRRVVLRRSSAALVAAASCAPHPHLLSPVDLLTDDDGGLVVVSDEPGGERLDVWARRRGTMSAGEAVTVLLPVIAATTHLARRGTVLGGVGLEHVVLDERGAPVLVGGDVASEAPARPRSPHPGAASATVTEGARTFVEAVALQLSPGDRDRLLGPESIGSCVDELVERVHDLAQPVALPTTPPSTRAEDDEEIVWRPPADAPPRSGWTSVLPESALVDMLADWWEAASRTPLRDRLRSVRPRFWALGALVAVSLVIGAIVVPQGSPSPVSAAGASPPSSPQPVPVVPTGASVADAPSSVGPVSPEEATVRGDDAAAAASVLLRARIDCVREPSTSCLAAVDQSGSPAAAGDSLVFEDPSAADDIVLPVHVETEVQRLGESVLFDCRTADDEPASVLVVRTEAGWRLREVLRR